MSSHQQTLGQYELQQLLRSDSTGEVWKAFDVQQRRYVFVKTFRINAQSAPDFYARFQRATQLITTLRHPNILSILDVRGAAGSAGSDAYIVTDYVEGPSLADVLQATSHQGHFLSSAQLVRLLTPIAAAIDYAHQQGVIHGDIKPLNILLDQKNAPPDTSGEPKLTGFGTHYVQNPRTLPLEDVYYISPELAQGYSGNDRSDLYSLGIILYELCTGILPFQGDTAAEVMMQHIHASPPAPMLINPHILPALTSVIMRSIAKEPTARFPTATAMVVAVAKAFQLPTQDISMSGISGWSGNSSGGSGQFTAVPSINAAMDPMNSPTMLSTRSQPSLTPSITPSQAEIVPLHNAHVSPDHSTVILPEAPGVAIGSPALAHTPAFAPTPPAPKRRRNLLYIGLVALLLLALLISGLVFLIGRTQGTAIVQKPIAGYAFFASSGLLGNSGNQGIADRLQIDLQNISPPQSGKSYYAWLEGDSDILTDPLPILLGTLTVQNGHATAFYAGDTEHTNLLVNYSRLLVTEEDSSTPPSSPSLDPSAHRFYAAFSQQGHSSDPKNPSFSVLDHFRHLLAQDPKLKAVGITGGLDIWLFRNVEKIVEAAGSARDAQPRGDIPQVQRQLIRILDYLDGDKYILTENLPSNLPTILIDPTSAHVALLEFDIQNQQPPGYLRHIGTHLREASQLPASTSEQRAIAIEMNKAIDNVQAWLNIVHDDAAKLIHMTPTQLAQPDTLALLNDLATQANYAFVGQIDPNTTIVKEGVVQIHYNSQRLATFTVTACTATNTNNPCA